MSALTDLFTAMANKIRSKTGTATTYTPLEMVSDGIDDVYDAGYAAGGGGATGTPITPSNSSPASMTSGTTYEAQANGYAIASYSSATPSNENPFFMQEDEYYKLSPGWAGGYLIGTYDQITPSNSSPVSLSSGFIYKMGGAGKAVASVTDITPSDSSPASLSSGSVYKAGGAGYAIASSPTSVTPSSSGTYFTSGIKKMSSSGYAYSAKPTPTDTTLWTNSAPTSSYSGGDVTLSQSIENFDLIGIEYLNYTGGSTTGRIMIDIDSFKKCVSGAANNNVRFTMGTRWTGYSNELVRMLYYLSDTQVHFSGCTRVGASGAANGFCIPQKIVGIKL